MEGEEIERVKETKFLGEIIKSDGRVRYFVAEASKQLFYIYLRQFKQAGLNEKELVRVYKH